MRKYIIILCACAITTSSFAQNLMGSYFMDGMTQRTDLNPAFEPDLGYVTIPVLGGFGVSMRGNIGLGDFVMPNPKNPDAGLVTFLHKDVALSDLTFHNRNILSQDFRLPLFGLGFRAFGGFNTLSLSVRENMNVRVPGEMFTLLKDLGNRNYQIGDLGIQSAAWGEVALGHSHQVNKDLRIGAKVKFLIGAGRAEAKLNDLRLDLSAPNRWTAHADARVDVSVDGFTWGAPATDTNRYTGETYEYIDTEEMGFGDDGFKAKNAMNGFGFGVDLGLEYDLSRVVNGLKVSAAVTDLGFIKWNHTASAANKSKDYEFTGFNNVQFKKHEGDVPIEDQAQQLADDFVELYSLQDCGTTAVSRPIGATLNVGVEYALPMYKRLKFGLLSTTRLNGSYTWNEERLSVSICPINALEFAVNGAVGSFGPSWGWVLNIKPKGFNLFVGMDHMLGKLAKPGIPLNSNADVYAGINFTFGKRK